MIKMVTIMYCRRKEEDPEERPSMGGRGHPLFGNLNPFDILQHLLKQSRSTNEVFFLNSKFQAQTRKRKRCRILFELMRNQFHSLRRLRRGSNNPRGASQWISLRGTSQTTWQDLEDIPIRIITSTTV